MKLQRASRTSAISRSVSRNHSEKPTERQESVVAAHDPLRLNRDRQPLTTIEELWDIISTHEGQHYKDMELSMFLEVLDTHRVVRVSHALAKCVPQGGKTGTLGYNVTMTRARMRHLCTMIVQDHNLSLFEARVGLESVEEPEDDAAAAAAEDPEDQRARLRICYRGFKRLMEVLPGLFQLEAEIIIAQLAWEKTSRVELPEVLMLQLIKQLCGKGGGDRRATASPPVEDDVDKLWALLQDDDASAGEDSAAKEAEQRDKELLVHIVSMEDFMVFCRCGRIVDPSSKAGANSEDLQRLYHRVHRKIFELLEAHAKKRNRTAKPPERHRLGLVGRNELEVLVGELFLVEPFPNRYTGPFDLLSQMILRQLEEPFLDEHVKATSLRESRKLESDSGPLKSPFR